MAPPGLSILAQLDGNVVAAWKNVFLQVRRGVLTEETFDRIVAAMKRHRIRVPRGGTLGTITLVEEGWPIPAEPVRIKQRALVADHLKDKGARFAVVVVGESLESSLLRSASRGVVPSHPQLRLFDRAEEACAWIASELEVDAGQLEAVVDEVRRLAASPPDPDRRGI